MYFDADQTWDACVDPVALIRLFVIYAKSLIEGVPIDQVWRWLWMWMQSCNFGF